MRSIRAGFGARSRGVSLENEDGLSPEAAAAIGAGDKSIPAPKKDGEVPANVSNGEDPTVSVAGKDTGDQEPKEKNDIGSSAVKKDGEVEAQLSNGEDPTVAVATGGEGKTKELVGTAGALESRAVKVPKKKPVKFSAIQRARIKVALEDDGLSSAEAEEEIRRQEEGVEVEAVAEVPVAGEEGRVAEVAAAEIPPVGEAAPEGTDLPPADVAGDPAELAAGAEAAAGEVPGADAVAAAPEVPAAGTEVPEGLGGDVTGDAGVDTGVAPAVGEMGAPEGDAIDPVELDNARRLVARAEERGLRAEGERGTEVAPMDAGAETAGLDGLDATGGDLTPAGDAAGLPTEVEAEADQIEDSASGLETELVDIAEGEADLNQADERIEDGFEVAEAMEAYREALSIAAESGGLDRHGARMLQIGLESCYKRLDLVMPRMMSLESFGGASKKISATQLSMEALGEQLKAIWEKIYNAIVSGLQMLTAFGERLFNGAVALEARAKAIGQKLQSVQGQPNAREIDDQALVGALFSKSVAPFQAVVNVVKVAQGLYGAYPKMLGAAGEAAKRLSHADGFINADVNASTPYPWTEQLIAGWGDAKKMNSDGGMEYESAVLPGGKVLMFRISQNVGSCIAGMDEVEQDAGNAKLPVLSVPQAGTLVKQVQQLAELVKQSKQNIAQSVATGQKLAQVARMFSVSGSLSGEGERKDQAEQARAAVIAIKKALDEPFKSFNAYALKTGGAALAYVEKSMAMYGAPAAAKPAAPAAQAPAKA